MRHHAGLLTVTLVRAFDLSTGFKNAISSGASAASVFGLHTLDPFVDVSATGPAGQAVTGVQHSTTVYGSATPRWDEAFEFALVPAGGSVVLVLWDRTTAVEGLANIVTGNFKGRSQHSLLGRLCVPLLDVAQARRVRSSWPLVDSPEGTGSLELVMEWVPLAACVTGCTAR
ncbi:MAG: hypothetical protein WDW36_007200 [Sanguina aurantia]